MRILISTMLVFTLASCATPEIARKSPAPPAFPTKGAKLPSTPVGKPPLPQQTPTLPDKKNPLATPHSTASILPAISQHEARGEFLKALVLANKSISESTTQETAILKAKTEEIIERRLAQGELESLVESDEFSKSQKAIAHFRLGEMGLEARDLNSAKEDFSKVVTLDEASTWGERAKSYLSQLAQVENVEVKNIGIIAPLTGKFAGVGQKTLRGMQLGLGLGSKGLSSFRLVVGDSQGHPEKARQAVENLVREHRVMAIVGGVQSKTASAEASRAQELGVPFIALTQKSGITDAGVYVHRNALTSEMLVRSLVRQAMQTQKMQRFAILYPNDPYGVELTNAFWDEVLARGGKIVAAQTYSPKETDFKHVVRRLVQTAQPEARSEEVRLLLREKREREKNQPSKKSVREEDEDSLLPPLVDFDAIFIPDSARALGQIAAMLSFNDVKGIKLLGPNLWNIPGLAKRAGHWGKDLLFVDSFSTADARFQRTSFWRDYRSEFSEDPGLLELQAYDSALILRQTIASGATSRESLNKALLTLTEVPGALSLISTNPEREFSRPVSFMTLESGEIIPLKSMSN